MGLRSPNRVLDKSSKVKRTGEMEEGEGVGPWGGNQSSLGTCEAKNAQERWGFTILHKPCCLSRCKTEHGDLSHRESRSLQISWFS